MTTRSNPLSVLAADPAGSALGLGLPPGALVTETVQGPWREPLLWVADGIAVPGARAACRSAAEGVGLLPVLLQDAPGLKEWWRGDLDPGLMSDPGAHDAESVLAAFWEWAASETEEEPAEDGDEDDGCGGTIAPFTDGWPGLAAAGTVPADPERTAEDIAEDVADDLIRHRLTGFRLALVPALRSADIPAAMGWAGPLNHEHENDVARLCAVLRSWEDRFGVRVVALSHDRLDLSVAAPPRTAREALAVAAEHFAFCPDNVWLGYETIRAYADEALAGSPYWTFWWD
jgi:uncharacterized protein DUF4253